MDPMPPTRLHAMAATTNRAAVQSSNQLVNAIYGQRATPASHSDTTIDIASRNTINTAVSLAFVQAVCSNVRSSALRLDAG